MRQVGGNVGGPVAARSERRWRGDEVLGGEHVGRHGHEGPCIERSVLVCERHNHLEKVSQGVRACFGAVRGPGCSQRGEPRLRSVAGGSSNCHRAELPERPRRSGPETAQDHGGSSEVQPSCYGYARKRHGLRAAAPYARESGQPWWGRSLGGDPPEHIIEPLKGHPSGDRYK
jgi:hypothetical protein